MKRILVVDAEYSARHTKSLLARLGFQVEIIRSAREALCRLEDGEQFDLMISELQLPDMSGMEFLAAVKGVRMGMPLIIVTNQFSIESYLRTISLGVFEYLNKPVITDEFSRIVRCALGGPETAVSNSRTPE